MPDPEGGDGAWQPVGLAEAAASLEGEAAAAQAAGTPGGQAEGESGGAGEGPRIEIAWERALDSAFGLVFSRLAERDPTWNVGDAERRGLAQAWAIVAEQYVRAPSPLAQAALATGVVVLPRAIASSSRRKRSRAQTVDADGGAPGHSRETGLG